MQCIQIKSTVEVCTECDWITDKGVTDSSQDSKESCTEGEFFCTFFDLIVS